MNTRYSNPERSSGFSLVELMVAMLLGLIILGGVMRIFISTSDIRVSNEDQLAMLGDARFAMETIAYDLRHTNMWGRHNHSQLIVCQKTGTLGALPCPAGFGLPAATADCESEFYVNLARPLIAYDNSNPYSDTCAAQSYKPETDILTVRYADTNQIGTNVLGAGVVYLRTGPAGGALFVGQGPDWLPDMPLSLPGWEESSNASIRASNHQLVSRVYYVSDYSDVLGDGLPSLRRGDLVAGPEMLSDVLLTGVEDFQLEYGVDVGTNGVMGTRDGHVDAYVKASSVVNWTLDVVTVRIWLLMRSEHEDRDLGGVQTFTIAGNVVTTPDDGYQRYLISSVVKLRNTTQLDVQTAGG